MLYAIAVVIVLILDQGIKYWATVSIALDTGVIPVIGNVFSLANIHNYGAAFGILQNARWLFIVLAVLFTAVVILALAKNIIREPLGRWSAVLIMAGAIGNLIDRIMNGYVVDMFRFDFLKGFPVFNTADCFITVCGILFIIYLIFGKDFASDKSGRSKKAAVKNTKKKGRRAPEPEEEPEADDVRTYNPSQKKSAAGFGKAAEPVENRYRPAGAAEPAQEYTVPVIPKPGAAAAPGFDPGNPFAEWEMPAVEKDSQLPGFGSADFKAPGGTGGPVREDIPAKQPSGAAGDIFGFEAPPVRQPAPETPKAEKPAGGEDFSLEDILAEFSSK